MRWQVLAAMTEGCGPQQDVTYRAPAGSVDLKAFDEDGTSYEVRARHDCLPWYAEAVVVAGEVLVRQWLRRDVRSSRSSSGLRRECIAQGGTHLLQVMMLW